MKIGSIEVPPGAFLAPMAGISDPVTREIAFSHGCALAVSEMLSAKGFVFSPASPVHVQLTQKGKGEGITGLQLFGHEEYYLSEAVKRLNPSPFEFFDFNMGCPARKIVSNGEGCRLMTQPLLAGKLIGAMVKASAKPVTVKLRAGWDRGSVNCVEIARIAQSEGASAVTVHPRTRDMFYSGQANWALIGEVKSALDIPVIGNGDIKTGQDALKMLALTRCDGVMVARGAQGDPWIFDRIRCALEGKAYIPPSPVQKLDTAINHFGRALAFYGERTGIIEMRKHLAWYIQGLKGASALKTRINNCSDVKEVLLLLNDYRSELEGGNDK
ncbi:MAG: tRNA dihydrouridine synthase DusB [Clostridiales bacterium]|nr:tRNA dihydrouridine synthase DusB [Clostridiales bacterium]